MILFLFSRAKKPEGSGKISEWSSFRSSLRFWIFKFALFWFKKKKSKKEDARRDVCLELFLSEGNTECCSEHVAFVFPVPVFLADLRSLCHPPHTQLLGPLPPGPVCSLSLRTGFGLVSSLDNASCPRTGQAVGGHKFLDVHLVFIWRYSPGKLNGQVGRLTAEVPGTDRSSCF